MSVIHDFAVSYCCGSRIHHESLHDKYVTLAEIMRSQGYATAAISQNQNAGYL